MNRNIFSANSAFSSSSTNNSNNINNDNTRFEFELNGLNLANKENVVTSSRKPSVENVAIVPTIQLNSEHVKSSSVVDSASASVDIGHGGKHLKSASPFINESSDFSIHDVNSTTNLIGLSASTAEDPLGIPSSNHNGMLRLNSRFSIKSSRGVGVIGGGGGGGSSKRANHNNQQLSGKEELFAHVDLTSDSQNSSEAHLIKMTDETESMNLMPFNNNSQSSAQLVLSEEDTSGGHQPSKRASVSGGEPWYIILLQVLLPFFIAGFGMVGAGVVLDIVQHWELFVNIPAIFTLIPALLGLKGNLEMTLASRFSTQVNLGKIKDKSTILSAVLGNFALTQAQAIIVGFLASVGALVLKVIFEKKLDAENAVVLIAGSMSTASFASLLLAGLMMFVIILSKKLSINPDNVATPIAASLGDLVTLTILSFLCTFLYQIKSFMWIHILTIILFFVLVPIFIYFSFRNDFVKDALYNGWVPIISAMIISSTGGFIMGFAVQIYKDIAVFQPVVNGVGGNLVAIFASRLSTAMHRTSVQGTVPSWAPSKWFIYPYHTFLSSSNPESNTALVLAALAIPGHLLFFFTIIRIKAMQSDPINPATLTPLFIVFYTSVLILQVVLLLLFCYWLVHLAWRLNKNPDNVCIPYLTAIGDLLGTAFLALCFHSMYLLGETRLRNPH